MTTKTISDKFIAAALCGTPLIGINCYDPEATMASLQKSIVASPLGEVPIVQWDVIRGWMSRNAKGGQACAAAYSKAKSGADATMNPVEQLELAQFLPEGTILFMINAHNYFDNPSYNQALWNLRDAFKDDGRQLVLLAPYLNLPDDIKHDVIVFDEPLPTETELTDVVDKLVDDICKQNKNIPKVTAETRVKAVDALRGVPMFPAEQSIAMAMTSKGLDVDFMWDYKRKMINDTPGLKVYSGTEKFDDLGGCDNVKEFMRNVIKGKDAPRVIVFIDEGEKMFAGATNEVGDNTGVSQDALASTLTFMEDHECDGAVFVGPPGAAKSAIAKAMGNEAGVPTIVLDLGGVRGSLVGESERKLREAYKVIDAVGGGKAYFIMTCNKDVALPPELKRRFTSGTFFFDLPSKLEQSKIWPIYCTKYGIPSDQVASVDAEGWTGAEIRNCCRMAYRQSITLKQASTYIIPVAQSAAEQIEKLRKQAEGRYLSASKPGKYIIETEEVGTSDFLKRRVKVADK